MLFKVHTLGEHHSIMRLEKHSSLFCVLGLSTMNQNQERFLSRI